MITTIVSHSGFGAQEYSPEDIRLAIGEAQSVMEKMEQVEVPVSHHFSDGIYGREIFLKKGTLFTGRIHKQTDLSVCLSGVCEILTPNGWKRCEAGDITLSKKGVKPIAIALEDTRWLTNHAATSTDLDELERLLFEDEGECPLDFKTGVPLDRNDYQSFLGEMNMTHDEVWKITTNESDRVDIDLDGILIKESVIHGVGSFTERERGSGDILGVARLGDMRTQLGRYVNHAKNPNCCMNWLDGNIVLVACKRIGALEELTVDYRQANKTREELQ